MSALQRAATIGEYQGDSGIIYDAEELRYAYDVISTEEINYSMFYQIIRVLSTTVAFGFVVLLLVSVIAQGPIHWAVSAIGLLGSIGLAGAVWFSKPYFQKHTVR